jgi:phospholipid transport system substrate-binding protein
VKRFAFATLVTLILACLPPVLLAADGGPAAPVAAPGGAAPGATAPEADAVATIEKLHQVIIEVMKNADQLGYEGRRARLEPVIGRTFDSAFMAEKSVGRYWKDFTDEQKRRWVETFGNMTLANYAGRFDGYSNQKFVTFGTEPAGFDTLLVKTKLLQPEKADDDVEINYRLHDVGSEWKVVDIYLSGTVSELALRRAEYASVLQRDGFDKLVADLEAKIEALRAGTATTD